MEKKAQDQKKGADLSTIFDKKYKEAVELAKKYSIEIHRCRYDYGTNFDGNWKAPHVINFELIGSYSPTNKNYSAYITEVKKLLLHAACEEKVIKIKLNPQLKGTKLPPLEKAISIVGSRNHKKPFTCKTGEHTLIYLWSSKIQRCKDYIALNAKMMDNHPEWSGRLKVVEISTDEEMDAVSKTIRSEAWERIEHLWVSKRNITLPFWKEFLEKELPYYILTDKNGYIVVAGDPDWINIEDTVEKWMEGEIISESYLCESELTKLNEKCIKDPKFLLNDGSVLVNKFLEENKTILNYIDHLNLNIEMHRILMKDKEPGYYGELITRYSYYDKYTELVEKHMDILRSYFKDIMRCDDRRSTRSFGRAKFGEACLRCKKELGECDQYMCAVCTPPVHYCVKCLRERDNIKSREDLIHPHAFFFIQKDSGPVLDELRIKSVSITDTEEYGEQYTVTCRACKKDKKLKIAWKCAVCENIDLCPDCFDISRNPNNPEHAKIRDICARLKHDVKTHIYVREDIMSQLGFHY